MSVAEGLPTEGRDLPPHLQPTHARPSKSNVEPQAAICTPPDVDAPMADAPASPRASSSSAAGPSSTALDPAMPPPAATHSEQTSDQKASQAYSRKRASAAVADEGAKRGRRMFGLLTSTLQQARGAAQAPKSGAAKKREELEVKLAEKVRREREEGERKQRAERDRREAKAAVHRIEDSIANSESIYAHRHKSKLHLAGFLCTGFNLPSPAPKSDDISVPFAPRLPHALRMPAHNPKAIRPIYYLPYKLLSSQEDQIDDQMAAVRKAIRNEKEDWAELKDRKLRELADAKERLAAVNNSAAAERKAREPSERAEGEVRMGEETDPSEERSVEPAPVQEASMEVDGASPLPTEEDTPVRGEEVPMAVGEVPAGAEEELEY